MSLFGLSPAVFAVGVAGLLAGVVLLHLLRVRLRRVEVDTLLFFQLAGTLRQPRVLPGRPARWLSLLLAALAVLAAWGAFARPHAGLEARSRVVVVEPAAGTLRDERLAAARALVAAGGLGPRGAVLAAAPTPAVLLAAGEPAGAIDVRSALLPATAGKQDGAAALRAAQDLLRDGDEIVWIGAAAPAGAVALPMVERTRGRDPAIALRAAQWVRSTAGAWLQLDVTAPAGGSAVLLGGGGELANVAFAAEPQQVLLGPVPPAAAADTSLRLQLRANGSTHEVALPPPQPAAAPGPCTVHVADDVPAAIAAAVRALLDVDPELDAAASAATATVIVAASDAAQAQRALLVEDGIGGGSRFAATTGASPVALSLRDRARSDAPALAPSPSGVAATVWVEDLAQGAPLVVAERVERADGERAAGERADAGRAGAVRARVRVARWLLEPATHADVPTLLAAALHALGNVPGERMAVAGMPLRVPAPFADATASHDGPFHPAALLPVAGSFVARELPRAADAAAPARVHTPLGDFAVHVLPAPSPSSDGDPAAPRANEPDPVDLGGDGGVAPWLLLLLFVLLAADAFLFHRGRLP